MNYLELINKCLVELNYKQVNAFTELIKNDHKKIKNILNLINTEVCRSDKWDFLLKKTKIELPKNKGEIENTINGKFMLVMIDGEEYRYYENFKKFFTESRPDKTYSSFNNKLLFPIFKKDKETEIIYLTANSAKDRDGNEKLILEKEDDQSLIPEPFAEPVFGLRNVHEIKGKSAAF